MTETQTLTLTDFLLVRIAEDEEVVRLIIQDADKWGTHSGEWTATRVKSGHQVRSRMLSNPLAVPELRGSQPTVEFAAHFDPARMLAECEAKRRIVARSSRELVPVGESVSAYDTEAYTDALARDVLEDLALPYADHPDYREEWAA